MNKVLVNSKKWIFGFVGIFVVAVVGVGIYFAAEKMGELTQKEAEALVSDKGEVLSFAKEWDWEFGTPSIIKMAVKTETGYEEIEMDASNGDIIRRETNHLLTSASVNSTSSGASATTPSAPVIMPEEAIKLALAEVKGNVVEIELDEEDHYLIYELEIEEGNREYNVHVDAMTGSILVVDTES
ncbi:PepSY domain-containing protein [Ureibacillus aquaedulcis]|uniref:PepSY domain-containing protein n=1 Tax=Ureibacillus aquaedulcis TaxID=3058421 RepID=A0ABT8GV59_9BACL|nr:PepSY domain-containing protein [Ureibacillus sp. BA0131]MDN4495241.1 PepSY domain-containing protein [Ureibacillus sp. BA0131]